MFLGTTSKKSASENFGTSNERTTSAKGDLRQFFGGYDHAHIFAFAALAITVVFHRNREAEATKFGQTLNEIFGNIQVFAMDVFRDGCDLFVRESSEGVLHHFEIALEVTRSGSVGQRCKKFGCSVCGDELACAVEHAGSDVPFGFTAEEFWKQFTNGVGNKGAGQFRFKLALGAVGEHRSSGLDCRRCVGNVVGHDLIGIRATIGGDVANASVDDPVGGLDDGSGSGEVRSGHRRRLPSGHIRRPIGVRCWL
ncbi:unannotated protein [freshwater metagenome]|uniref:Unannotated protein n=1 Tax=freshwater metagenome TaxID=449393 RepID=A0A6J6RYJ6_9ZZZZ